MFGCFDKRLFDKEAMLTAPSADVCLIRETFGVAQAILFDLESGVKIWGHMLCYLSVEL